MPTLHWIGKEKVINHHLDVPYRVLEHQYGFEAANGKTDQPTESGNKIIHGDNLEALKSLLPEYEGKVKCIYIDPPYNTGNEGWVYNDNVNDPKIKKWLAQVVGKEGEDLSRHDKWLCMMYPRLVLLHRLLAEDGAIFISIDDTEEANLRLILNEIFGVRNFVVDLIWQKMDSPSSNFGFRAFSTYHDHTLVFAKDLAVCKLNQLEKPEILNAYPDVTAEGRRCRLRQLRKNGKSAKRQDRPTMWFPIIAPDGSEVFPVHPSESWEGRWAISKPTYDELLNAGLIEWKMREHGWVVYQVELAPLSPSIPNPSILSDVGQNRQAKAQLNEILGTDHNFDTPKPFGFIQRILQIASASDSIVLDSFAGSGTTAHAVFNQNKQDNGNRKFILIEMEDYAETIAAERVKRVMQGYGEGKNSVEGTGGAFDYYTLGPALFDEEGNINEAVGTEKIRAYVWYTETRSAYQPTDGAEPYLLGKADETAYYFIYEPARRTTLDYESLSQIKTQAGHYVIYADNCLLTKDYLIQHNIVFKKIPRDISRF